HMLYRFCYFLTFICFRIMYPVKVVGKENIKKNENYIFICNHRSNSDPIILFNRIFRKQHFLAKIEMAHNKCEKFIIENFGAILIDRKKSDVHAIKKCLEILKKNEVLVVFPEGTRGNGENLSEVRNGAAMLSIKSGVKIIPMFIEKKPKCFHKNTLIIGEAFPLNEFKDQKLVKETLNDASLIIKNKIDELH
ncbi:MAG: lysophospholipid acyltransferase family protein, partial [Clostridia bacterium]